MKSIDDPAQAALAAGTKAALAAANYITAILAADAAKQDANKASAFAEYAADAALAANANYAADAPKADWETATTAHGDALDAMIAEEDAQLVADVAGEQYRTAKAAATSAYSLYIAYSLCVALADEAQPSPEMKSNKLASNAAYLNAMVRTKELLLAYEAAAAASESANLSRTGMFDTVYEAADAYDEAFEQLCAIREARDEAAKNHNL